ncbi:hypothetical protein D5F01_LYC23532 [Larimichthys crocea]|uniref:Uncharacterized protein n=1 Tax=Larimichthys crocea TaxID=215358 RepID=A0A6G0HHU3_LARCR|nr:hypothetical protein D5F01_LYC23532 [Larimichthys crocea]
MTDRFNSKGSPKSTKRPPNAAGVAQCSVIRSSATTISPPASAGPNLSVPPPFDHSSENPIIYMTEGEELGGARSRSGQLGNPIKKTKGRGGSALDSSRAKGGGGGGSAGFAAEPRAWKEREGGPVAQRHRRAELATMEAFSAETQAEREKGRDVEAGVEERVRVHQREASERPQRKRRIREESCSRRNSRPDER